MTTEKKYMENTKDANSVGDCSIAPCSDGIDCPNCDNIGWYVIPYMDTSGVMQCEERQCQWCRETPNSKFNLSQNAQSLSPADE